MPVRKIIVPVAALALSAVAVGGCCAPQPPVPPPATIIDRGAPGAGELTGAEPVSVHSHPGTKAGHVTYRSTTSSGTPDVLSGAVIAPQGAGSSTPIIGYGPGTLALGDQCDQSRNLDLSLNPGPSEKELIQGYTNAGYAVAITDHQRLATPGGYPYDVGRSEGHALLDVLRAAGHLPGSNLSPDAPVAVVGYSRGGLATGWAAQHATSTCRMGHPDDHDSVVDPACRVLGLQGLRVVDASIFPSVIRANTNLATITAAELMADRLDP